jgi:hypothetical protein
VKYGNNNYNLEVIYMLNKLMERINNVEMITMEQMMETNYFVKENINDLGFILIKNPELLGYYGLAITGLMFLTIDDVNNYVPGLIMDAEFEELSETTQKFIVGHELGHYKYHQSKVTNPEYVRDINDEFEADEYAANIVGLEIAITALEEIKDKLDEVSCGTNTIGMNEIDTRIESLMNKGLVLC